MLRKHFESLKDVFPPMLSLRENKTVDWEAQLKKVPELYALIALAGSSADTQPFAEAFVKCASSLVNALRGAVSAAGLTLLSDPHVTSH